MSSPSARATPPNEHLASYERWFMPAGFDLVNAAIFAPLGGVRRMRETALDQIGVRAGQRVLELGCGTGGWTRLLLARGATVHSIDGSELMLARARSRVPNGRFARQNLESLQLEGEFDIVLFAFVLHELPAVLRARTFESAARALAPGGTVAIVDHAVPKSGRLARFWRGLLTRLEPPSVQDTIARGYDAELAAAGLAPIAHFELTRGTAALTLARR